MLGLRWQQLFGSTSTIAFRLALAEHAGATEYGFDTRESDAGMIEVWAASVPTDRRAVPTSIASLQ